MKSVIQIQDFSLSLIIYNLGKREKRKPFDILNKNKYYGYR